MGLFRKEALEHQRDKYLGEVLILKSSGERLLVIGVVISFIIGFVFVISAQYNRRQSVDGYLTLSTGVVNIRTTRPGIIKEVYVNGGDQVNAGDILFLIENEENNSDGNSSGQLVAASYEARLSDLEQQKSLLEQQNVLADADLKNSIVAGEENIFRLKKSIKILQFNLNNSIEKYEMGEKLLKDNVISKVQVIEFKNEVMNREYELNSVFGQISDAKNEIENSKNRHAVQKIVISDRLKQLLDKQNQLNEYLIGVNNKKQFAIKAPTAGQVSLVNVARGELVTDDILAALLPVGSEVEADLLVPASAIAFVEKKQKVLIRYSSFPYQKYGLHSGKIQSINQSILLPADLKKSPVAAKEPVYMVRVKLDRQTVEAHGKSFSVRPGMLLSADIQLENRTVYEWLLEPLLSIKGRL